MDEAEIIGVLSEVGQQVGKVFAGLAAWLELPGALGEVPVLALECDDLVDAGHGLAVALDQFGFVVPGVEMADGAGAEDVEDAFGLGREMGLAGGERVGGGGLGGGSRCHFGRE